MPKQNTIGERIQLLRSRVKRYKVLAEALYDARIAAEVAGFADELEAELTKLEGWQHSHRDAAAGALAS